jgi:RNA recognition motif-containing protein
MLSLSVRGLPRQSTEASVNEMFAVHGKVHGLKVVRDLFSGECKGFAELSMEGHEARKAIAALDGQSMTDGNVLRVGLKSEARGRRR